jgi:hypothetical protein
MDISKAAPSKIRRSLRMKIIKINKGTISFNQRAVIEPIINNLSATGSSIFPRSVCHLKNLARNPSIASEIEAAVNKIKAKIYSPANKLSTVGITNEILIKEMRLGMNLK